VVVSRRVNSTVRRPDHYSRNAQDGKSLPAAGQWQIIVPNEKRHARCVRQVAKHQHHNAAAEAQRRIRGLTLVLLFLTLLTGRKLNCLDQ
jgi:hypothetical protein